MVVTAMIHWPSRAPIPLNGALNVAANQVQLGSLPAIGLVDVESTALTGTNAHQSTVVTGGTLIVSDNTALADGTP